jgi:hypothetical protein
MCQSATWTLTGAILVLALTGCASTTREGPPAPVVAVTPRQPAVIEQPIEPGQTVEAAPKPKPAAPAKQPTKTYAYREPGTEPPAPVAAPVPATAPVTTSAPGQDAKPVAAAKPPAAKPAPAPASASKPPATAPASPAAKPAPAPAVAAKPAQPPTPPVATTPAPKPAVAPQVAVATPPPQAPVAAPPPAPPPSPESQVSDKPLAPGLPPAADSLARQADQQRQQGDYAGAAATLERSLRIAPREAYLWNRLARVRMEQGLSAQAGQLAARSNDLAAGESTLKRDNWRIIAESKRRAGDTTGASEAEQRANGG